MKKRWLAWAAAAGAVSWAAWCGMHRVTAPAPFTFQGRGGVEGLSLSPDGRLLAEDLRHGHVTVFDTATGAQRYTLPIQSSRMIFSPDGRRLLTRSRGNTPTVPNGAVEVWDAATGAALSRLIVPVGPPGAASLTWPRFAATSSDLRWAVVREPSRCAVYDLASGRLFQALPTPPSRRSNVSFSPDGRLLAVGSDGGPGGLQLWETQIWRSLPALNGQIGRVSGLRFSPDGSLLAVGDTAGLTWWDLRTGKRAGQFPLPTASGLGRDLFYFSSDSRHLTVAQTAPDFGRRHMGASQTAPPFVAYVVDCATGQGTMSLPDQFVEGASLSGNRVATVLLPRPNQFLFFHETHSVEDVCRGQELYRIVISPGTNGGGVPPLMGDWQTYSEDLSADGHTFAVGGYDDGIIHVWHLP